MGAGVGREMPGVEVKNDRDPGAGTLPAIDVTAPAPEFEFNLEAPKVLVEVEGAELPGLPEEEEGAGVGGRFSFPT